MNSSNNNIDTKPLGSYPQYNSYEQRWESRTDPTTPSDLDDEYRDYVSRGLISSEDFRIFRAEMHAYVCSLVRPCVCGGGQAEPKDTLFREDTRHMFSPRSRRGGQDE